MDPASEPQGLVLGTAGHIDHGKTALVRALTGIDTDRLPEEKSRGITIELGFAALELAGGLRVSVVDVPGHERLVRTMVSGATGIDCVLLVVAADEGVMPQTREHVAICNLLGLDLGVVALTKIDLADEEMCELAAEEVRDLLSPTTLAQAPIVPVSSSTGDGIDALRSTLTRVLGAARAHTARSGAPRLGVDRVFAMKGFGAVVTGTLVGSPLHVGENIELLPSGLRAKIRGLQSHGEASEQVGPGARCAVNLQGVDVADVARGQVLTIPGAVAPTLTLDLKLFWLGGAPTGDESVAVEFLIGTAERRAHLAPLGADSFAPGAWNWARAHIEGDPVVALPGDRFIVRGFARLAGGGATLGGGLVLDAVPPRRRRSDPALVRGVEILAGDDTSEIVLERIRRRGLSGIDTAELMGELGFDKTTLDGELSALQTSGRIHVTGSRRWLADEVTTRLETALLESLAAFHRAEPLRPGMPRAALRGRLPDNVAADAGQLALSRLEASGAIDSREDLVALAGFAPTLGDEDARLVERLRQEAKAAGLEPASLRDWAQTLGVGAERLRDLLAFLERESFLVKAPGDLWFHAEAIDALRGKIVSHLEQHGELTTPDYKAIIGTTRRAAVPLMELFDEQHLTHRKGEVRILRKGGS